jgi:hypothetical protein
MNLEAIQADFRQKVGARISLAEEGLERYRVLTPFVAEDGDHLSIVIKRENGHWVLSDEGHTFMHLTYDIDEKDFQRGSRQRIITNALSAFSVTDSEGELRLDVPGESYGNALFSFIQALLKINDVSFLSRERIKSTFIDDFKDLMEIAIPSNRRVFDWFDSKHDPEGKYMVDCRLNGNAKPLMIFALPNDDKARDATISLLQFERWGLAHRSLAIYEDQEEINRKVLARFSDMCEKQFSSLGANRDRIKTYLSDVANA